MQLFGKSADSLAGIVDDGGAALRSMGDEAEAAGLILSQEALDGANAFNDGVDTLKAKAAAAFGAVGNELAQTLLPAMDGLVEKISGVLQWVAQLDQGQLKLMGTLLLVVAAISPVAKGIQGITTVITALTGIIPAITGGFALFTGAATTGTAAATAFAGALTFITGPAGIVIGIIAAVVAAIVLLWNNCEGFRNAVTTAWTAIQAAFQTFIDWLQATFAPVWDAIVGALQAVFDAPLFCLRGIIVFVQIIVSGFGGCGSGKYLPLHFLLTMGTFDAIIHRSLCQNQGSATCLHNVVAAADDAADGAAVFSGTHGSTQSQSSVFLVGKICRTGKFAVHHQGACSYRGNVNIVDLGIAAQGHGAVCGVQTHAVAGAVSAGTAKDRTTVGVQLAGV